MVELGTEASVRMSTIQGLEQIEGGNYSRKYGNGISDVSIQSDVCDLVL